MRFVEVIVNVPIRRSYSRQATEGPPQEPDFFGAAPEVPGEQLPQVGAEFQSFHYHLPPELEAIVLPGHLVWVPFGTREVQGFVIGYAEHAPVPTKAVRRLARMEPVLNAVQLELAQWLAQAYVAPLSEAIKLFTPPGLLSKEEESSGVRAKRELQVRWAGGDLSVGAALAKLARETQQTRILEWLLTQERQPVEVDALANALGMERAKVTPPLNSLIEKGLVARTDGLVRLIVSEEVAQRSLAIMRGVDKYVPVIETLRAANAPMWKSELYGEVDADLNALRRMQAAGLIALDERVRFRDPLAGRIYPPTVAPALTTEQAAVWAKVQSLGTTRLRVQRRGHVAGFLIHGVTGSGKT
jgi:primosomal protein N' (replication factor Y)